MRVTLHLTTGENLDVDIAEDQAEALEHAIAEGFPRALAASVWRRKGSTSTAGIVTVVTARIVYAVRHRPTSTAVEA